MNAQTSTSSPSITTPTGVKAENILWRRIKKSWQLYLLLLIPVTLALVFAYYPMLGAQIAFRDYSIRGGIWHSEWAGLENFQRFFDSYLFWRLIRNTITLGLYGMLAGFPIPIILALSLNQVRFTPFKKVVQLVTYAPHFISVVVMVGLVLQFLNPRFGMIGMLTAPKNLLGDPNWYQSIFVWSDIWQHMGFSAIVYLAALTTIDPALHEAAIVDGASRLRRIWHIDIPGIMPVVIMIFILNLGNFLNIGFEKALLLQNPLNLRVSEIIDTYVYQVGIAAGVPDFSYATAIGLFKSLIAFTMVLSANVIVKRMGHRGLW